MIHAVICPIRSRWRRARHHTPFWRDDKVARLLNGVAYYGCPRCGRGAIEERDAGGHPDTCPTRCVEDNHPGREHAVWVNAWASERDVIYPAKFGRTPTENYVKGYRCARADLRAALASAEATADTQEDAS